MKKDLTGKKLLVLGGNKLMEVIVAKAKSMGIYTVVTDNRPLSAAPVKLMADEYRNIDFSDYAAIKELISSLGIEGVMTGFSDADLEKYLRICTENNLPCYLGPKQLQIAVDKTAFKAACIASGVPVIPGINAKTAQEAKQFADSIGYPIMLKPADNSGSRGVVKCESEDALEDAFAYALSYSDMKTVITEKYLSCGNIAVSYFASEGNIRLSTTDDRMIYISEETGSSISCYSEYPSSYTDRYLREVNDKVINMLRENGFREGMISLQAFVDEKQFYFCEMCYRLSGGQHFLLTEDQNGIDQLGLMLEFAVTGSCSKDWESEKETPFFDENCAMLRVLGIPGKTIAMLGGFDALLNEERVMKAYSAKHPGDTIGKDATTPQVIGNILYRFSKAEDRALVARELMSKLRIEDESGNNIAWFTLGK